MFPNVPPAGLWKVQDALEIDVRAISAAPAPDDLTAENKTPKQVVKADVYVTVKIFGGLNAGTGAVVPTSFKPSSKTTKFGAAIVEEIEEKS